MNDCDFKNGDYVWCETIGGERVFAVIIDNRNNKKDSRQVLLKTLSRGKRNGVVYVLRDILHEATETEVAVAIMKRMK